METSSVYTLVPGIRNSFNTGWKVMMDNFLRLLLVVIILSILVAPFKIPNFKFDLSHFPGVSDHWTNILGLGILAAFFGLIAFIYGFLVAPVFEYGGSLIFVHAVRRLKPDFELLVRGFTDNYLHIVLANLLVMALVVLGFIALIVPGIIIACRLVFVSYLVMDKKLDPIEAVETSWRLTRGHGWKIFFMGVTSFFIIILGLIMVVVGIFPALMWIAGSFAALYQSVLNEKEKYGEKVGNIEQAPVDPVI